MRVEFPLGASGETITVTRPTENQLFALTLLRKPTEGSDHKTKHHFIERVIRFLERLTGTEQWSRVEELLFDDVIGAADVLALFGDIMEFEWDKHAPQAQAQADAEAESGMVAVPTRPAPRVVSGG